MEHDERPWGEYWVLDDAEGHKVKRMEVRPGKRLSLQKHQRRSEHWFVVEGTAHPSGQRRPGGPWPSSRSSTARTWRGRHHPAPGQHGRV